MHFTLYTCPHLLIHTEVWFPFFGDYILKSCYLEILLFSFRQILLLIRYYNQWVSIEINGKLFSIWKHKRFEICFWNPVLWSQDSKVEKSKFFTTFYRALTFEVKLPPNQKGLNNLNQMNLLRPITSKIKRKLQGNTVNPFHCGSNESNFSKKRKYKVKFFFFWRQCLYDNSIEVI